MPQWVRTLTYSESTRTQVHVSSTHVKSQAQLHLPVTPHWREGRAYLRVPWPAAWPKKAVWIQEILFRASAVKSKKEDVSGLALASACVYVGMRVRGRACPTSTEKSIR